MKFQQFQSHLNVFVYLLGELIRYVINCPTLNGRSIAVVKENSSVIAKLWDFCVLEKGMSL